MKQILLIEDNEDHAELIHRSLVSGLGSIQVDFATTAHEAYEMLDRKNYDVILCDYYLPDTKGEIHIRELSKLKPNSPIIVITGQGDEKVAARSIKAGAEDYIVKTREALVALPNILKRAVTKHHFHQNKKRKEIKKQSRFEKGIVKKVLFEVDAIRKKIIILKRNTRKTRKKPVKTLSALEHLAKQIETLKKFVRKTLSSRK